MKTIDFSYFIERYNAGEMSEAEKQWFRKELDGNEKLRSEVLLRKKTDEVLRNQNIISLRNKLSVIEKERASTIPVSKTKKQGYVKYAALFAGLVLLGSISLFTGKNITAEEILNQYYKTYEPQTVQRSGQTTTNSDFNLALELFNIKDFQKAALLFNKIVESDPKNIQSVLLDGISNFEIKKYPEARSSFNIVINDNNNLYIDQAQWYLALCYVSTNEREKAASLLEIIRREDGIYSKEAKKILRRLK
jgi:tetratricopeptide (TPR) repeat protein